MKIKQYCKKRTDLKIPKVLEARAEGTGRVSKRENAVEKSTKGNSWETNEERVKSLEFGLRGYRQPGGCIYKGFNKEFDPGSGRTLAARLTHASRTEFMGQILRVIEHKLSGGRVSNT